MQNPQYATVYMLSLNVQCLLIVCIIVLFPSDTPPKVMMNLLLKTSY